MEPLVWFECYVSCCTNVFLILCQALKSQLLKVFSQWPELWAYPAGGGTSTYRQQKSVQSSVRNSGSTVSANANSSRVSVSILCDLLPTMCCILAQVLCLKWEQDLHYWTRNQQAEICECLQTTAWVVVPHAVVHCWIQHSATVRSSTSQGLCFSWGIVGVRAYDNFVYWREGEVQICLGTSFKEHLWR